MEEIEIRQNDKDYYLCFTLQDSSGTALNLSSASLKFNAQKIGADDLKVEDDMEIVDAVAGECRYQVKEDDFDEAGDYYAEIQVSFIGGQVTTYGDILINVKPELPR